MDLDDDIQQGWGLDAAYTSALRIGHIRKLIDRHAWPEAVLEAEEFLDTSPSHIQALELLAKAQVGLADAEGAVLTWEQVLCLDPTPRADRLTSLAMARLDTCDLPGAVTDAREAIRLDPGQAEAHFVLGLALDYLPGHRSQSAQALLAANRLDPETFPFPISLDAAGWEQALTTALLHVAPEVRSFWDGVPVRLPERPSLEDLTAHAPPVSPRVLGMFLGAPPEDSDPWQTPPEGLVLFSTNLARVPSLHDLIQRLADVLEQEALVWVGEDPWGPDDLQG